MAEITEETLAINEILADELKIPVKNVTAAVELLDAGNTVPFIARYRKEVTGSLDDNVLRTLEDRLNYLRGLEKRRGEVRALIDEQGKLTDEITAAIAAARTVTEIDDIYRPFRPKRKTRASAAREKGLSPLAAYIMEQRKSWDVNAVSSSYINEEKGVTSAEDAISGALDIIAEDVSDNAEYRRTVREMTFNSGKIVSKKTADNPIFEQYADYSEPLNKIPPHRLLAINRGEKSEALSVSIEAPSESIVNVLLYRIVTNRNSPSCELIIRAVNDAYSRLIAPSVEREIRNDLTDTAGESAIRLFSLNLHNLLMQSPLKGKTVLGYDPGYRTGCKLAVVTQTGSVAETAVIYPTKPREDIEGASKTVLRLIKKYGVDVVSIGNGTASAESELFIADLIKKNNLSVKYIIVSEAGASVYSASELGAEEFPDFDVTERSAVSIARRLQDPLAELVKIEPKAIGVGQYQHDMKQNRLEEALEGVVESCVNSVGVDVNTASYSLLSYISGINSASAKNIVKYRDENGEFRRRKDILKVPRFGAKAFEQAAGFLRIPGGDEALDNTGVHPESYAAAKKLLELLGHGKDKIEGGISLRGEADGYGIEKLAAEIGVGVPTLNDIITELEKPGRDIRDSLPPPLLRDRVMTIADLSEGMVLTGKVRNVTDFGAFVDIGVHEDGLLHISEISNRRIKHPSDVLAVGDTVRVTVLSADLRRNRISLTMKNTPQSD